MRARPSAAEWSIAALVLAAFGAKAALAEGASARPLHAALWAAGAVAVVSVLAGHRHVWLDRWRLGLLIPAFVAFPSVYGALAGDGFEYYAFARSALFDGDLDFANDFAGFGVHPRHLEAVAGAPTSRVPIGQALLWAPFLALAHVGALVARVALPDLRADGFSPLYGAAVTSGTFLLGIAALALLEALLRRRFGPGPALLCALALLYATPLHFYIVANPFMSHGSSVFAATLFVVAWLRAREDGSPGSWLWAGAAGGLMSLVRAQDGVLLALPLLDLLTSGQREAAGRALRYVIGPAIAVLVQTLVWRFLFGADFVGTVATLNWVGTAEPNVEGVLFSPRHGLFTWTPLYLLAAAGWLVGLPRRPRLMLLALAGFALAVLVNANLSDWWGSHGFGQRRLLVLTPLFALGLAEWFAFVRRWPLLLAAGLVAALAGWTAQFAYIYNSNRVGTKDEPVTLDRLLPAQVDVLYRSLIRARPFIPAPLFAIAYDNLSGWWLDEGPRPMGGRIDLGYEPTDIPGGVLGTGWFDAENEGDLTLRRSRGRRSWLRLPVRTPGAFRVVVRARREFAPAEGLALRLEWNGWLSPPLSTADGWRAYTFEVPRAAVVTGFNEIALVYSTTPRETVTGFSGRNAAMAVDWLRFFRLDVAP